MVRRHRHLDTGPRHPLTSKRPPQRPAREPHTTLAVRLLPLVVGVLTVLAFGPALLSDFVSWDDEQNFLLNADYRGLGGPQLKWMWSTFHLGHYMPITWMSLGLDYSLWGMDARGYHLSSVLLHAANAVLFFVIARLLLTSALHPSNGDTTAPVDQSPTSRTDIAVAAAFAALVFAVHPLRVESVAWVTERRDALSELFALLSLWCYLRATAAPALSRRRWYLTAVVLFAFGLLSKATVLTLPALLLLLNVYPLRRVGGAQGYWNVNARRIYVGLSPFAALSVGSALMSFVALQAVPQLPALGKAAVSFYSIAFYLWKSVVPTGLSPLYEMPLVVDPFAPRFVLATAVVLAASVAAWLLRRRWPAVPIAWLAFVIALSPMLGVHQNGPQIAADRYTYPAAPALALLAAGALAVALARRRQAALVVAAAVVLVLGTLTWRQSGVWQDSNTLWAHTVRSGTGGAIAHNNFGNALMQRAQIADAEVQFRRATELRPEYSAAFNNLGVALARQGRAAEALAPLQRALALQPEYDEAAVNLGAAFAQLGDQPRAVEYFSAALRMNARNTAAHINWGNALVRLARPLEAIPHYEAALTLEPTNATAQANLDVARTFARDQSRTAGPRAVAR